MEKKEAYRQLAEAELEEQRAKFNLFKARAKKLYAKGKIESYKHMDELEAQLEGVKDLLKGLGAAKDEAWEDLKRGFERAREDLSRSLQKVKTYLD